ncbi:MAG: exodeoxyribonuclease VII large subunit [Lentisphaeria bacterium]|nr:exodeoxyribonuclease VII large subunit [Lentisphaeria bacterium]
MTAEKIWQVSEVTAMVREMLEQSLLPLWISGEIGNLTLHRSGHVYMTIKDANAQMKAVFFNGATQCRALDLRQGAKVEVLGKLSLYQAGGEFQLNVRAIRLCGVGTLQEQFEAMKQRLADEGLFDASRKKEIPFLCRRIGLVTSPSGAAVKDFIKVATRRFPGLDMRICPAPVQGNGAENKLSAAIRFFNRTDCVDVIVLTRGGGSLEDLWPFNEEVLARAIAASRIPVVSAVGHEIDFTIADFAADLRAPSPSAAAEMIVPEMGVVNKDICQFRNRICNALQIALERAGRRLEKVEKNTLLQRIENTITEHRQKVDMTLQSIFDGVNDGFDEAHRRLDKAMKTIELCSPMATVRRGFAILTDPVTGDPVTTVSSVKQRPKVRAVLSDGTIDLDVPDQKNI